MEQIRQKLIREEQEPHPIIVAIRTVCEQMNLAQNRFQQESDPDLIEAAIYELQSLRARYRYYLRVARDQGISSYEKACLWDE